VDSTLLFQICTVVLVPKPKQWRFQIVWSMRLVVCVAFLSAPCTVHVMKAAGDGGISGTRRNVWAKWGRGSNNGSPGSVCLCGPGRTTARGEGCGSKGAAHFWAGPAAAARPRRGRASARYPSLLLLHEHDRSTETVLSAAPARCYSYLQAQPTHHPCCGQQDCDWRRPDGRQRRGNGKSATDRCELSCWFVAREKHCWMAVDSAE
jgi:hypothetical protein